jgi:uncharacterized repeat protein (TIGR02543 family)
MPSDITSVQAGSAQTLAAAPSRNGYSFAGWRAGGGASGTYQPGASLTMPAADVTFTATWANGSTVSPGNGNSNGNAAGASNTDSQGMEITDTGVPLFASLGQPSWSLVDLLLAILGVILALAFAIRFVTLRRRPEDDNFDRGFDGADTSSVATGGADAGFTSGGSGGSGRAGSAGRRPVLIVAGAVLMLINVIIFLLTQDLAQPMVLADIWTPVMAAIAIGGTVTLVLGIRKSGNTDNGDPPATRQTT